MEFLDKLIPLAILCAVAGLLLYLLRRAAREAETPAQPEVRTIANPLVQPDVTKFDEPAGVVPQASEPIVATPTPTASEAAPAVAIKKPRRLSPMATAPAPLLEQTVPVVELLKDKDSLATAFLLREILAPPVSKRG